MWSTVAHPEGPAPEAADTCGCLLAVTESTHSKVTACRSIVRAMSGKENELLKLPREGQAGREHATTFLVLGRECVPLSPLVPVARTAQAPKQRSSA